MGCLLHAIYATSQFMQLADEDRWLILEAGFYLVYARLATLTTSARTLLALGGTPAALTVSSSELPLEVRNATDAIEQSAFLLGFDNCLVRALALRMLLARRDLPSELHIGARKDEHGAFAAHAWLTYHDTILVGGEDARSLYRELVGSDHALLQ